MIKMRTGRSLPAHYVRNQRGKVVQERKAGQRRSRGRERKGALKLEKMRKMMRVPQIRKRRRGQKIKTVCT